MTPQVKICGLTRAEDVDAAIAAGADYLGFIVETPSKRRLSISDAARTSRPARGIIPRVAVTVNLDEAVLGDIVAQMAPDFIQFHGDESPKFVAHIGNTYDVGTIKALPIKTSEDLARVAQFNDHADLILFDAKPPENGPRGGHGLAFDWTLLNNNRTPDMYALAGGLTPNNVAEAVARTNAPILDVSSGVEAAPGVKDPDKLNAFIKAAKHG